METGKANEKKSGDNSPDFFCFSDQSGAIGHKDKKMKPRPKDECGFTCYNIQKRFLLFCEGAVTIQNGVQTSLVELVVEEGEVSTILSLIDHFTN